MALVAGTAVLACLGGASGRAGAARLAAAPIRIDVGPTPVTAPLPSGFLGIALENRTIPQWVGNATSPATVDPIRICGMPVGSRRPARPGRALV